MAEKPSPEEFRSFVRDLGVRAFDQLASRFATASDAVAGGSERLARRAGSLSMMAGYWSNLPLAEKEQFFDQMIAAAQAVAAAAPALVGLRSRNAASSGKKKKAKQKKAAAELALSVDSDTGTKKKKKKKKKKK